MTYLAFKKAVLADLGKIHYRATAKKWDISFGSLQNFLKQHQAGDEFAGMTMFKHWTAKQKVKV